MTTANTPMSYDNSPYRGRGKRRKETLGTLLWRHPGAVLALFSLLVLAVAGIYWHTQKEGFLFSASHDKPVLSATESATEPDDASTDPNVNRRFMMSGVNIGMTRAMVEANHPNAQVEHDRTGKEVLTIPTPNGMMVAWFKKHHETVEVNGYPVSTVVERVYRLRQDEAFLGVNEQDLISRYARKYGRPIDTSCTRGDMGDMPRCTYYWWGGNGIELQATLKRKVDINGQEYTLLTTVATDTTENQAEKQTNNLTEPIDERTRNRVN